jgi:hypothetical protein
MVEDGCGSPLALPRPSVAANQTRDGHHQVNVSMTHDLAKRLWAAATKDDRTCGEYARRAIEAQLDRDESAKKGAR